MFVNHSGWNEKDGSFDYNIFVDENKTDYEIHYNDGTVAYQKSPFQFETADWNCDGQVYEQFGAWFEWEGRGEFITPDQMVWQLLFDGYCGPKAVSIPGIDIPQPSQRPSLDETILSGERKALMRETKENHEPLVRPPNSHDTNSR